MVSAMVVRSNLAFRFGNWKGDCIGFFTTGDLLRSKLSIFCDGLETYFLVL